MPPAPLLIVGAGHVGQAVHDLAQWLGFRPIMWDDRADLIAEIESPAVAISGSIADALAAHPMSNDASIVVVTRNVNLDVDILPHLLATPARFIGLMGSDRRWKTTRAALANSGVDEASLDRVITPIGVEIHAETPEEIAISILAQVIGERRGARPTS